MYRYVDCDYVARARTFAETKSLNGLGELATPEDIAFDYGMCKYLCLFVSVLDNVVFHLSLCNILLK